MPPKKSRHDWTWVEVVKGAREITDGHRLLAAGLRNLTPCTFAFPAIEGDPTPVKASKCTARSCEGNPACYNYLGTKQLLEPAEKRKFLNSILNQRTQSRKEGIPAGLRNLGATCYANAFLQLWFHNIPFRNAIYACSPVENSPLYHLAHIFASLQYTEKPFVDPMGLIEALRLNKGEQQDAAEFSKLFLEMINNELLKQRDRKLKSLTKDLFEGTIQYTTTCDCGFASHRDSTFLELELSLKEGTSLEERLAHSLTPERLEGDNQYFCQACGVKRDAIRSAVISQFPPVLHFSLLRFVFDSKTFERKKSRAAINFPRSVQLGGHTYRLQAIITHTGPSAHEGHFVCEAQDETSGMWFMCNDEDVSVIERSRIRMDDGDAPPGYPSFGFGSVTGPPSKRPRTNEMTLRSKDAYMLVYTRLDKVTANPPPADIKRKVDLELAQWHNEQGREEVKRYIIEEEFAGLVGAKKQMARVLPGMDCLVPTAQLQRWFGAEKLDELFRPWEIPVCPHGEVDPDSTGRYKLVSLEAFELLQRYGFDIPRGWRSEDDILGKGKRKREEVIDLSMSSPAAESSVALCANTGDSNGMADSSSRSRSIPDSAIVTNGEDKPSGQSGAYNAVASSSKEIGSATVDMSRSSSAQTDLQTFDILPRLTICPVCVEEEFNSRTLPGMSKEDKDLWRAEVKSEKSITRRLTPAFVCYEVDYYYLPDTFVELWHQWIKNEHAPRPALPSNLGRCEHGLLEVDLEMDSIQFIDKPGWDQIVQKYGNANPVTFQFPSRVPTKNTKRSAKQKISVGTCDPCRQGRLSDFVEAEIFIKMERTSSSTSRRSKNKEVAYDVKKSMTVVDIKVEIMHQTGITPINLTLYYNDRELQNEETVASIGILAGDQIRAKEMEMIEVEDDEQVVEERGFGGTALHGLLGCPVCTYQYPAEALKCEMCDHPFGFKDE